MRLEIEIPSADLPIVLAWIRKTPLALLHPALRRLVQALIYALKKNGIGEDL